MPRARSCMPWLIRALFDQREMDSIDEGLACAIRQYYFDLEDADEIDPDFYRALSTIAQYGMVSDIDILIDQVQRELTSETGRTFVTAEVDDDDADTPAWSA